MTAIVITLIINFLMIAANVIMHLENKNILERIGKIVHYLDDREKKEL